MGVLLMALVLREGVSQKSSMSHLGVHGILSSQRVAGGEESASVSHRAHLRELVNRSLSAHWLCCHTNESDCSGRKHRSLAQTLWSLVTDTHNMLSLNHRRNALLDAPVLANKMSRFFFFCLSSCTNSFFTPYFSSFQESYLGLSTSPSSSSIIHFPFPFYSPFSTPITTLQGIYLICTFTQAGDRNRCTINYALKSLPPSCIVSLSPLSDSTSADAVLHRSS